MNQLSYGWNLKDLQSYDLVDLEIQNKLCGAFIPHLDQSQTTSKEETQKHYYLASLNSVKFHKFDPKKLSSQNEIKTTEEIPVISKSNQSIFSKKENIQDLENRDTGYVTSNIINEKN
jgi:hypothetical protein